MNIVLSNAVKYEIDGSHSILDLVTSIYDNFNKQKFDKKIIIPVVLKKFVSLVYKFHRQEFSICKTYLVPKIKLKENDKHVVLGFSGGLDSCYQAFRLREKGYVVHLFHVKNINTYENAQATHSVELFSKKFSFPLIEVNFIKNNKKDNPYRQYWPENTSKNQVMLSMMIDYCIDNGYNRISLGDDLGLSVKNAVIGTNGTDAKEITKSFLDGIKKIVNIVFIPIEKGNDKGVRLKKLKEYACLDMYYSCVSPGRFNAKLHDNNCKKYKVNLPKHNCGSCRKCAMHFLILKETGMAKPNKKFENHCWKILYSTKYATDSFLFSPDLSKKQRIKNLFEY
jgi:7-cyano-7-deazaguanine synthase in queuosine biosynthesis